MQVALLTLVPLEDDVHELREENEALLEENEALRAELNSRSPAPSAPIPGHIVKNTAEYRDLKEVATIGYLNPISSQSLQVSLTCKLSLLTITSAHSSVRYSPTSKKLFAVKTSTFKRISSTK